MSKRTGTILRPRYPALGLMGWAAITFAAAAVGALASRQAASFYAQLTLPDWAPPGTVFGPVWTALYLLMGIAAWVAWRTQGFAPARTALYLYLAQLTVNALWSWLFFAWRLGGFALIDIACLWVLVAATLIAFWRVRPIAGALLLPYLLWVSFAAALNYQVWRLNPQLLG